MIDPNATELPWLWAGLAAYAIATVIVIRAIVFGNAMPVGAVVNRAYEKYVLILTVSAVALLAMSLAERWVRIGHGPFVNLFELLISQLFSLGLIFAIVYWRFPVIRPAAIIIFPALWVLGIWVLLLDAVAVPNPPTYFNDWKWAHVGFGKVFLGLCLMGTGLAGVILLRGAPRLASWFRQMPSDTVLDFFAWRFMLLALIFESFMLIAGAVWAQDAWGRYWQWDALETSAFLNWLVLGACIHARLSYRMPIRIGAIAIIAIFMFAFFTYFGTPFYSQAAHKGVL